MNRLMMDVDFSFIRLSKEIKHTNSSKSNTAPT